MTFFADFQPNRGSILFRSNGLQKGNNELQTKKKYSVPNAEEFWAKLSLRPG
jgi:hypothetical protein